MINKIYATKEKSTQAFVEGKRVALTSLKVGQHVSLGQKTLEKDGYQAQILGLGQTKKEISKPVSSFFKKLGLDFNPNKIREIRSTEVIDTKSLVNLEEILTPGSLVNVTAISKGKGTSGVMKRWGFHGGNRTHGQSDRSRAPGSIARGTTPGRIVKGKHMAGHMGDENICVRNLRIHTFDNSTGLLTITGLIPGCRGALASITITKKA